MAIDRRCGARERAMEVGTGELSDAELLSLVLGTGERGHPVSIVAASLLESVGDLPGLARAGLGGLASHRGIGPVKAARLAAAIELGRRIARPAGTRAPRVTDPRGVHAWAEPRLVPLEHEELWLLALDGRSGLRAARRVAAGGLHGVHVAPRDPLRIALREGASAFVLVHNHPSGDPTPSREDVEFTWRIRQAAEQIGAPLLDHVVVARDGFASVP